MKRVISIFSALVVLCTILLIPVSAAETDSNTSAFQPTFENLLDFATEYEMQAYKNGSLAVTQYMQDPIVQINSGGYDIHFIWGDVYSRVYYDYILFGLQFPSQPVSVTFNNLNAIFLNQSDGICYYKVNFSRTSNAKFDLLVDLGNLTGELKLVSCYGIVDTVSSINEVSLKSWGQLRSDGQYYMQNFFDEIVTVPYLYTKEFTSTSPAVRPDSMYIEVSTPIESPYVKTFSLTFLSPCIFPNDSTSDSMSGSSGVILTRSGLTVETLPYTVSHSISYATYYGQPQYLQTVNVDLSGVDLSGSTELVFRFYLSPIPGEYIAGGIVFYRFQVLNIGFKSDLYSKPWYMRLFYWFQGEFSSLRNHLVVLFNNIDSTLKEGFGVGESVPDISDQQQQIQDDVGGMDQIGGEMEDSREEMEELLPEMPSWEDTGLDGFDTIVGSYIQQIKEFFTAIYENVILSQILTYTFLFALGGFILFGERM